MGHWTQHWLRSRPTQEVCVGWTSIMANSRNRCCRVGPQRVRTEGAQFASAVLIAYLRPAAAFRVVGGRIVLGRAFVQARVQLMLAEVEADAWPRLLRRRRM